MDTAKALTLWFIVILTLMALFNTTNERMNF